MSHSRNIQPFFHDNFIYFHLTLNPQTWNKQVCKNFFLFRWKTQKKVIFLENNLENNTKMVGNRDEYLNKFRNTRNCVEKRHQFFWKTSTRTRTHILNSYLKVIKVFSWYNSMNLLWTSLRSNFWNHWNGLSSKFESYTPDWKLFLGKVNFRPTGNVLTQKIGDRCYCILAQLLQFASQFFTVRFSDVLRSKARFR